MQSSQAVAAKPCSSRTWVVGLSVFITGSLLNFAAFTFASASILVPIEAVQFVVNVIFNKYVNQKAVSPRMLCGVVLTIVGTVFCVVFGSGDARCFNIAELQSFWGQPLWIVYLCTTILAAIGAHAVHERYARAAAAGARLRNAQYVMPVAFAVSSALLGGAQMIVHSKAVAEIMELQFQMIQPLPLAHHFFYVEMVLLSGTGIFWLYRMNKSLGLYDPLFIIPLLQSSYILFGVIAGGIYFQEFAGLHNGPAGALGWPLFLLGMLGVLSGLALIAPPPSDALKPVGTPPHLREMRIARHAADDDAADAACADAEGGMGGAMMDHGDGIELADDGDRSPGTGSMTTTRRSPPSSASSLGRRLSKTVLEASSSFKESSVRHSSLRDEPADPLIDGVAPSEIEISLGALAEGGDDGAAVQVVDEEPVPSTPLPPLATPGLPPATPGPPPATPGLHPPSTPALLAATAYIEPGAQARETESDQI